MRIPPAAVLKAIRDYHGDLGLEWDERQKRWHFTYRDERFLCWEHEDGTPAIADLSVGEALRLLRKSDQKAAGGIDFKGLRAAYYNRKTREERYRRERMAQADAEAHDRARVLINGPTPHVAMA